MKKGLVLFVIMFVLTDYAAKCQMRGENDTAKIKSAQMSYDKKFIPKMYFGVGGGFTNMFGDFSKSGFAPVARVGIGCRFTANLSVDAEVYHGGLSSNEPAGVWTSGAYSETSTFTSADVNLKFTLGNYLQYPHSDWLKILSGLYIGMGVGIINSNITSFDGNYSEMELSHKDSATYKKSSEQALYIPLDIGLRIPLKRLLPAHYTQLWFNYQINYTFSDYIDGVKLPASRNQFNDCYTTFTMGLSFHISKKHQ